MTELISTLKTGNADHPLKPCCHLSRKGHIKATGPERRKLGPHHGQEQRRHSYEKATALEGRGDEDPYIKIQPQGSGMKEFKRRSH